MRNEAKEAGHSYARNEPLMRKRGSMRRLDVFKQSDLAVLDSSKMGAIGFCFGAGVVLELARSGTEIGDGCVLPRQPGTPDAN